MLRFALRAVLPLVLFFAAAPALLRAGAASAWTPPTPVDEHALQIVFVANLGDHYGAFTMNRDGSEVATLSLGGNPVFKPVCSGNGARLAFTVEEQLYVMRVADEQPQPIEMSVNGLLNLSLSGDGSKLALTTVDSDGAFTVDLLDLSSGAHHRLLETRSRIGKIALSPDGGMLLLEQSRGANNGTPPYLAVIRAAEPGRLRALGTGAFPAWSPDGRVVVYSIGRELKLLDIGSTRSARLLLSGFGLYNPAWSPDGRAIAFGTYVAGAGIQVMNAYDQTIRALDSGEPGFMPCFLVNRPSALLESEP